MSKRWLAGISAIVFVTVSAARAGADDITAKKILIKDPPTNALKRQVQVQSNDPAVAYVPADAPNTNGASLLVYSASDNQCFTVPGGLDWKDTGTKFKYKNKTTKILAQIKNGKLLFKVKANVTYDLADDGTQGFVNAQVQFGTGTRYCMKCPGNKKDDVKKFLGKDCAMASCDPEPIPCDPPGATTTTTTTTTSTTTTTCPPGPPPALVLKGALTPTAGRFNYSTGIGLPAANAKCNADFPGTHACTYAELQAASAACDLVGLQDTASATVTGFWAIDNAAPILTQCNDDGFMPSNLNWEYQTNHTGSKGDKVALNNAMGTLGPLLHGNSCNFSGASWVGCCQ